jgi:uncharacterized protein YjbJ (UPF0337 family)
MKGRVRQQWGELTENDVETIGGKREQLIGRLEERYGMAKDAAERAVKLWIETVKEV